MMSMAKYHRAPFAIHETEEGERLLDEIRNKLRSKGLEVASFNQHGREEPIEFDIMTGLWVYNHGKRQSDIHCIACPNHPELQYEFIIHDLENKEHRPIGSTCILKRSLGEADAARYGERLKRIARTRLSKFDRIKKSEARFQPSAHEQEHARLLKESGNVRNYLKTLGLEWVLIASIARDEWVALEPLDSWTIQDVLSKERILREREFARLQQLDQQRGQRLKFGISLALEHRLRTPSKSYSQDHSPVANGEKKKSKKKPQFDRLKFENSPASLSPEKWKEYIQYIGYDYEESDWKRVSEHIESYRIRLIKRKMSHRIPLSEGDINTFRRAYQLWERQTCGPAKEHEPLYRMDPLNEDEATERLLSSIKYRLRNDGYRRERHLLQKITDTHMWVKKFMKRDIEEMRTREVEALTTRQLIRISKLLEDHHDWKP